MNSIINNSDIEYIFSLIKNKQDLVKKLETNPEVAGILDSNNDNLISKLLREYDDKNSENILEILKILINYNINLNHKNNEGYCILYYALKNL